MELSEKDWNSYELWYKTNLNNHVIWAVNEAHLEFMIDWFSNKIPKPYNKNEEHLVETYPKWMITNKAKVLEKLKKLKNSIHDYGAYLLSPQIKLTQHQCRPLLKLY